MVLNIFNLHQSGYAVNDFPELLLRVTSQEHLPHSNLPVNVVDYL